MTDETRYRQALQRAFDLSIAYLKEVKEGRASTVRSCEELRSGFDRPMPVDGEDSGSIVSKIAEAAAGGLTGSAGGRFFGWVIGGSLPSALAADWLAGAWDQNAALYACSPASAIVEEVAGRWIKELLELPSGASFAFVTGCQMAHVTCLAAARHAVLETAGWDVEERGLAGAPAIRIITSSEYHGSIIRALKLLGLGTGSILALPADGEGRLTRDALERALRERPDEPTIVLLQAGDVNTGIFDPFTDLVPLARRHGAWVHVDGAFGLWARTSPSCRHLLDGVEGADSWTTDGHKWLNVPYDCGIAVVARPEAHRASMSLRGESYLDYAAKARDQMDWNPEFSRRARGFAVYAALCELGRSGLADLIDRTCRHARSLVAGIGALAGAEVVRAPVINQGLVRFLDPAAGADGAAHDHRTDAVMDEVLRSGEAFFTGTTWRGRRCMRVSVSSWRTGEDDVARAIRAVGAAVARAGA